MPTIRYKYRWGRYVLAGAALGIAALGVYQPHAEFKAQVFEVIDGDTVRILTDNGIKTIRVWGIDAPEIRQTFGNISAAWAAYGLNGHTVTIDVHDTDRYGRLVAEIELPSGDDFGVMAVKTGHARWYAQYAPKSRKLRAAEIRAREARAGLWSEENPTAPWDYRRGR